MKEHQGFVKTVFNFFKLFALCNTVYSYSPGSLENVNTVYYRVQIIWKNWKLFLRTRGAPSFINFTNSYKETEKDWLNKLNYRQTSKIAQIEIEIEELDELINTKLDPAEKY